MEKGRVKLQRANERFFEVFPFSRDFFTLIIRVENKLASTISEKDYNLESTLQALRTFFTLILKI